MEQFEWLRMKLRRGAIRIALLRPMPERLTLGDRRNNNYNVRIEGLDFRFLPTAIHPEGIEGWWFVDGEERVTVSVPNHQLTKFSFKVIHHYMEFMIDTKSPALFIVQRLVCYPFFAVWLSRAGQFIFNRRRLARQDRMTVLRYIFNKTVDNSDFKTSSTHLPAEIYGMRFYGRGDHDALLSYYGLILNSLLESGDLRQFEYDYSLAPKAVATLDAHETQQERHRDNIHIQRRIAVITVVLAILAAAQVGTTVWQELHPDPKVRSIAERPQSLSPTFLP